jgi:molybdopterin molybdotransferase
MISVDEALEKVLDTSTSFGKVCIPLSNSIGCILAESIFSDRPIPPFDRVTMDGIAIKHEHFAQGQRKFEIEGIAPAGSPQFNLQNSKCCVEVMTGASLPIGTDTVIRYEDLTKEDNSFTINVDIIYGKNVHLKGSDHAQNEPLITQHTKIKAIDINVLASVGKSEINILGYPKVAVISSGDELVEVEEIPKDYQIRKSNVHMLMSRLNEMNVPSQSFHFKDDEQDIFGALSKIMESFCFVIMSGGVSKGKFDFIPDVLEKLEVKKLFHKVAQRPGKPFWFGQKGKKVVFALPGNPVSTLACFHKYFIPWLNKSLCQSTIEFKVKLLNEVTFKPNLHYLAQGKVVQSDDATWGIIVKHGNGSGDLVSPTMMDGFVELTIGQETYDEGGIYNFIPFHPIIR